jgi:ligand-binding sensor domain-containing protein
MKTTWPIPTTTPLNSFPIPPASANLPSLNVLSIAEDKDNTIWIGSDKGVAVIYNPYNVFGGGDFDAQKIIVEEGGYAQYLLESESVTAIAVDGANRKWFGTVSSGAYLQSADGTQKILNFNTDNSPLLSNNIVSIAISDVTGEVFFGTDKGIISYRGTATEGKEECTDTYAFPNPVKHDYHGPICHQRPGG